VASLAIPRVLGWRAELARLRPLTRQIFWTYAGYVWVTNLCFGLLSTFGARLLLDRSPLAAIVSGYVAGYWTARLIIQLAYFDRSDVPPGWMPRVAEAALAVVYAAATLANLAG